MYLCMYANTQPVLMGGRYFSKLVLLVQLNLQTKWCICHLSGCCHKDMSCVVPLHTWLKFIKLTPASLDPWRPDMRTHTSDRNGQSCSDQDKEQSRQCCPVGTLPSRGCEANCTILLKWGWAVLVLNALWYRHEWHVKSSKKRNGNVIF